MLLTDAWTAEAAALQGDAPRALELADAALALVTDDASMAEGPLLLLRVRAVALAQLGERDAAIAALRAAVTSAREHAVDVEIALGLALLAQDRSRCRRGLREPGDPRTSRRAAGPGVPARTPDVVSRSRSPLG